MAYAHARGVIHRDLKPSNVMVGSFGEVQVMDWGLAKVLARGGIADEAKAEPVHETVIMTVRSGSAGSDSESQAGSVLGTPAYMAPEQARGEVDRIDERADVFGLGAILCEILTGRPPYAGSTREEIRARAARGDLANSLSRLEACGTDAELIDLARDCLAAEPEQRLRNADEVAQRISGHLAGVQDRLKAAELARVEAQTRAEEAQARAMIERSRRRRTVALAAAIVGLVVLGGGGTAYLARQRAQRRAVTDRGVTAALAEARVWRDQACKATAAGNLELWAAALVAARYAHDLVAQGEADAGLRAQVDAELIALEHEQEEAKAERRLLDQLETIRGSRSEHWDPKRTDAELAAAFRAFGIDLDQLDPREAGKQVARRSAPVELASYLDDWALQRRKSLGGKQDASWRRLLAAAQVADPDPWRVALRDRIGRDDQEALRRLATDERTLGDQSATSLYLLAVALIEQGDRNRAEPVLRRAWRLQPNDFWVSFDLGMACSTNSISSPPRKPDEATRFYSICIALRPRSFAAHSNLGNVLKFQGKLDEAIAEHREALRLKPDLPEAHSNLGNVLVVQGKLDEAIAEHREALRLKPDLPAAHLNLGYVLVVQGKPEEAIAEYREALRLKPDLPEAHNNLGCALRDQGKLEEAIAEYREALRLKPDLPSAHNNLGNALRDKEQLEEAIAEFREALRLEPDLPSTHNNLGNALRDKEQLEEAIAEYREALRLKPDYAEARTNLGQALVRQGKLEEAIAQCREAIRLKPDLAGAHTELGNALANQSKLVEAIAAYRTAIRLEPGLAAAHNNLGLALMRQGKLQEAIAAYREVIRLKPGLAEAHGNLGLALRSRGDYSSAIAAFRKARDLTKVANPRIAQEIERDLAATEQQASLAARLPAVLAAKVKAAEATDTLGFARLCQERQLYGASARLSIEAFQAQPKLADDMKLQHRYNAACAAARAGSGQSRDDQPLDEATKVHWRKQALDWLKADLAAWSKILASGPPQARQFVAQTLQHWKADPDLAGIRDQAALAKLPAAERNACRALWSDVDALLTKVRDVKR
jgi:serine/threonine-protein kinase